MILRWRATMIALTVSGKLILLQTDFANSGNITVTNSGNFTANTFANTGTVNADTVTIGVTNFANGYRQYWNCFSN